ncbi:MAG: hypothetical protein ABJP48_00425 [Erythrobacter sp.]
MNTFKAMVGLGALAIPLTACGPSQEERETVFRDSFVESCITSAGANGTSEEIASPICECSADKLIAEVGIELSPRPSRAQEIMETCIAETGVAA